jgi:hypothetical protein
MKKPKIYVSKHGLCVTVPISARDRALVVKRVERFVERHPGGNAIPGWLGAPGRETALHITFEK